MFCCVSYLVQAVCMRCEQHFRGRNQQKKTQNTKHKTKYLVPVYDRVHSTTPQNHPLSALPDNQQQRGKHRVVIILVLAHKVYLDGILCTLYRDALCYAIGSACLALCAGYHCCCCQGARGTYHCLLLVVEVGVPAHRYHSGIHAALEHGVAVVDTRARVVHPLPHLLHVHVRRRDPQELGASPEPFDHRRRYAQPQRRTVCFRLRGGTGERTRVWVCVVCGSMTCGEMTVRTEKMGGAGVGRGFWYWYT